MEKQKNIPALRFPEFQREWEKKKLGEVGDVKMCRRIFNEETSPLGEIPFFKIGSFGKEPDAYISKELYFDYRERFSFPKKGDILISAAGTIGRTVVYNGEDAYYQDSNIVWIANENSIVSNEFLFYILQIVKYNTEGGTIQRLYNNSLRSTKFSSPTIPEQTKIATFLKAVDDRLNQLKQKKILLEQYKEGVMQKIFDQEIRFKEVDGNEFPEWELKKMMEIGEFKNGINKGKEDFGFGFPFINLMDVFGKSTISDLKLDLVNANEKELKLYELKKGDVLFIRSSVKKSGVGETSLVLEDLKNTVFSGFLIRFRDTKLGIDLGFKKYCFAVKKFRENLIALSTTSANTNINQESLNELVIPIPSLEEQTKIANFLSAIDEKIYCCTDQISKTEQYKKGLLQKMFC